MQERHAHGSVLFPFEIFDQTAPAGSDIVYIHWHRELEWTFVVSGAVDFFVDGAVHRVEAGNLFTVESRVLHRVSAATDCHIIACVFDRRLLGFSYQDYISWRYIDPFLAGDLTITPPIPDERGQIAGAFAVMLKDCADMPPYFELDVRLHLMRVFALIMQGGYLVANVHQRHAMEQVERVIEYVEQHYAEPLTSKHLAQVAGYQPQYFSRFFKRATGYSPIDYLNRYRISRACHQLLDPDKSILDISVACGFQSASYFIKKFKEVRHMPPNQYRKALEASYQSNRSFYTVNDVPPNYIAVEPYAEAYVDPYDKNV